LDASWKKWVIIIDDSGQPCWVLDADHFLRDALFNEAALDLEVYWHRPVIVSDMNTRLGDVMGRMKVRPKHPEDDVIDNTLINVSNRLPATVEEDRVAKSSGGLVAAL
jgi:metal transporter CNNM